MSRPVEFQKRSERARSKQLPLGHRQRRGKSATPHSRWWRACLGGSLSRLARVWGDNELPVGESDAEAGGSGAGGTKPARLCWAASPPRTKLPRNARNPVTRAHRGMTKHSLTRSSRCYVWSNARADFFQPGNNLRYPARPAKPHFRPDPGLARPATPYFRPEDDPSPDKGRPKPENDVSFTFCCLSCEITPYPERKYFLHMTGR